MTRTIRAPRGTQLTCKNWLIEAAYRMIQNNLDPQVAGDPENLIVYGGRGRAARNWDCFDAILEALRNLEPNETLLVQSGKPVAVFTTHEDAPRVLIANSNIVPAWATQANFDKWEQEGLIMYGQMTAGSWIYIGTQGILQGTYETLGSLARQHGWDSLKGKFVLTAGLGEMGGAQPLAITMNEGVGLIVEVDRWRAERRLSLRQIDSITDNLEEAMTWVEDALMRGEPKSVGLIANAADAMPELVQRGVVPDVVTDQTSAHDPLYGYIPLGLTLEQARQLRQKGPAEYQRRAGESMARHVQAILDWKAKGSVVFDYGNNLRQRAYDFGVKDAFSYPGFVPAYIRPLFCEGKGPFRWVVLSGDPHAPVVIGRDHLDSGSVASPNRETEGMRDGSDAIADWPLLNALLNAVGGATWVSIHHGGGVGIGYSIHAGQVIVADGTEAGARRLQRVLTTDPGTGVARHADAGYTEAIEFAKEHGIKIPMLG